MVGDQRSLWQARIAAILLLASAIVLAVTSCASSMAYSERGPEEDVSTSVSGPKSIFVFLDGTANEPSSKTNVWKAYRRVLESADPSSRLFYVEGVGTRNSVPGLVLGTGMETRMLLAYRFIAEVHHPGDSIYIFGFSRGAHQARALAGFLAYAGVPDNSSREPLSASGANHLIEIVKAVGDDEYVTYWESWLPGKSPPMAGTIKGRLGYDMQPVNVQFVGVWDTVPGSSFKRFEGCKEEENRRRGDRYKTNSYPSIRNIYHAVSLDEKRSKFSPLLVCAAMNPSFTHAEEVWFPGAHADVGGGYDDSSDLSDISLEWMLSGLQRSYSRLKPGQSMSERPAGLAHWSMGDRPANARSQCVDRRPGKGTIHSSVALRHDASPVPLRIKGKQRLLPYPLDCSSVATLQAKF